MSKGGEGCQRRVKTGPSAPVESGLPEESSGDLRSLGSFAQSELGRIEVVEVEQWAEIRRLHFVKGISQREIRRRTGLHRDTIRRAINGRSARFSRPERNWSSPGQELSRRAGAMG
jgi:hypothetical protein